MSDNETGQLSAVADAGSPPSAPAGIWIVAGLTAAAVLLQITVFSFWRLADGIPDVVVPTIVIIALLRGALVGAVVGFGAGLTVELTSPIDTLGVLALLYLIVGAVVGRYCEREESRGLWPPLVITVAAALFVQAGFAVVEASLGTPLDLPDFVSSALLPSLLLTALLTPPIVLLARRTLGRPRVVEPYTLARP
ncbi:MAG: rod shape-determining protein MreD [Miltoncostaeaceae bacterium]